MKMGKMRLGYRFFHRLVYYALKLPLGIRVYGADNVPRGGKLLIVSNHISELDPPVLGSTIPREVHYAAKMSLFKGILGRIIRYLNAIPVRRSGSDKEAVKALVGVLREDKAALIFPEGTRSLDPNGMDPKAGVGMIATMAQSDLLPVRVFGTHLFPKNIFRPGAVTVQFGQVISLQEMIDTTANRKEAYRKIAEEIMRQVQALAAELPSEKR
jgi:1-acyl-sn-glycerol-3-phosphate acyltransferase